jgi:uncharacterized membrane protein YeaQ/YmgE (transglycosylase-associated protein family)
MGGLYTAILVGLLVGLVAKALIPGNAPGDFVAALLLGVIGAVFGSWIGDLIEGRGPGGIGGFGALSFVLAVLCAVALEWLYRRVLVRRRGEALGAGGQRE